MAVRRALYRLTNETIEGPAQPTESEGFGYDAVGNRIVRATSAGVETSTYDANDRLLSEGAGAEYAYDANGNLIAKSEASGITAFTYDAKDRLLGVSGPAVGVVEHRYDWAGDRIETRVDGVATKYLVDANRSLSQVIEERSASSALVASYMHDDAGNVLERRDALANATSYYLHDAQLSVRQIANGGGAISDAYDYSAFGRTLTVSGPTPNAYRYGGQWEDPRTQLYHLRARWMDPRIGKFLSTDPFAGTARDPRSAHSYLYAHGSPVSRYDRSGRFTTLSDTMTAVAISGTFATLAAPVISLRLNQPEVDPRGRFDSALIVAGIEAPPEHLSIRMRIEEAEQRGRTFRWGPPAEAWAAGEWFWDQSVEVGAWNYKLKDPRGKYDSYGNWHWGVMAAAFGVPYDTALIGAGAYQWLKANDPEAESSPAGEGVPWFWFPFGDQRPDALMIWKGWNAYDSGYRGPAPAPPGLDRG